MTKYENLLLEAVKNLLKQDNLGITTAGVPDHETSHHVQFQYEEINDAFAVKISKSPFFDALHSIFYNIHSYKWISDPLFCEAFTNNCRSQGIPEEEIIKACEAIEKVKEKYVEDNTESNAGWSENLPDINKSIKDPANKPVTDQGKETFSGKNKPYTGVEPKKTRPVPIKV